MPDLQDRIYCSEQIHIPPTFPYIMKLYCKAAIRTQPYDLLKWSAAYFRALANGEEPPVKERVEYPPYDSPSGLTPGYIKILINQFGKDPATTITAQTLFKKWSDICLDEYLLIKLIALLGANTTVNWVNFIGVCAGFISKTLTQTMVLICELFTEEPEGGMATVPYGLFVDLYIFLAQMNCGPLTQQEQMELGAIMDEEDVCEVADRIKQGEYEGELEGELMYGEDMEAGGEGTVEEEEVEVRSVEEDETSRKGEMSYGSRGTEEEVIQEQEEADKETKEEVEEPLQEPDDDAAGGSESSSVREQESLKSVSSVPGESPALSAQDDEVEPVYPDVSTASVKGGELEVTESVIPAEEPKPLPKKINLEDLDDSVRAKIEEKLGDDSETLMEEEDREFEELGSYLFGASGRVQKFTAETLGFKIFRRYMRQDVPGIGPVVDSGQVEKVVDFLDFWSHKQELMVMPRNIRHWMCPPLDKIPTPEP